MTEDLRACGTCADGSLADTVNEDTSQIYKDAIVLEVGQEVGPLRTNAG